MGVKKQREVRYLRDITEEKVPKLSVKLALKGFRS